MANSHKLIVIPLVLCSIFYALTIDVKDIDYFIPDPKHHHKVPANSDRPHDIKLLSLRYLRPLEVSSEDTSQVSTDVQVVITGPAKD